MQSQSNGRLAQVDGHAVLSLLLRLNECCDLRAQLIAEENDAWGVLTMSAELVGIKWRAFYTWTFISGR